MTRVRLSIAVLATLVVALMPGVAHAGKRSVPSAFAGVTLDGGAASDPAQVVDAQFGLMARSGVESVRTVFSWPLIQPRRDGGFDFASTDAIVGGAARHGLGVLPVMLYAPEWARAVPAGGPGSPPLTSPYRAFLRAAIGRYGTRGSFWRENPSVPRRPIRYWQVWNEPHFRGFWNAPPGNPYAWPRGYARLLSAADSTIHRYDPRAKTVTAGLFGAAWDRLGELYRSGGVRHHFDVVAAHVYTGREANVLETVRRVNRTMRHFRERGNRVWITETAFPASKGRAKPIGDQGQETPRGMAKRLYNTYLLLARNRKREHLDRVYWYTWASSYREQQPSNFDYAGLLERSGPFAYRPQPALSAFRRIARRLEGCAKAPSGRCR